MLWIEGLTIAYDNQQIINGTDLKAMPGLTCIVGRSGIGKTSILNAIAQLINYQCTGYHYNDRLVPLHDDDFVRQNISYLTQGDNFISDLSCLDNIRLYASFSGISLTDNDIRKYLDIVHLDVDEHTYPDNLSGGEKQRLAMAQALAKKANIILCDEFTASLDVEMKHEIIELLYDIAHRYNKIVIVTTHDREVYKKSDVIYEITDRSLNCIKDISGGEVTNIKYQETSMNSPVIHRFLRRYISSKIERNFSMYLMYSIIMAIVVSTSSFLIFYWTQFYTFQEMVNDRLNPAELTVVNQSRPITDEHFSYTVDGNNQPFDTEIAGRLKALAHVEKVYPHHLVQLVERMEVGTVKEDVNRIEVELSNGDKHELKFRNDELVYTYVVPYYPEQNFEKVQYTLEDNSNVEGVYLSTNLLHYLGFNYDTYQQLKGATLKTTLYFPISYEEVPAERYLNDEEPPILFTNYNPISVPLEVEIPIKGVQFEWYLPETSVMMYLPYEMLEGYYQQIVKDHINIEPQWHPNTYKIFLDDPKYLEEVNHKVKQISSQIATGGQYYSNINSFNQSNYVRAATLAVLCIVIGSGFILSFVFGIYHYQKNKKDDRYFKRNKLSVKEYSRLLLFDILMQSIVIAMIGLPLLYFIFYLSSGKALYAKFEMLSKTSAWILFTFIIVTTLQTIVSRIYSYIKYKG